MIDIYQLWVYTTNRDICYTPNIKSSQHDMIVTSEDLNSLELIRDELNKQALAELIDAPVKRNFYIRKRYEPTYLIYNIDYSGNEYLFKIVYSDKHRDQIIEQLALGHKKYNTRMTTKVIDRDDSIGRGDVY